MDWVGSAPPTAEALVGRSVLSQGHANVKTITHTGGEILGFRPLDQVRLSPDRDPESTWGFMFITRLAEHTFGGA